MDTLGKWQEAGAVTNHRALECAHRHPFKAPDGRSVTWRRDKENAEWRIQANLRSKHQRFSLRGDPWESFYGADDDDTTLQGSNE